jgi:hypothetical protein
MNEKANRSLIKILNVSVWVLLILSIMAFYVSLRTPYYSLEYSLIALGLWGIVFGLNYWLRKIKKKI